MDADLKQYMDNMKAELKAELKGQIESSEARIMQRVDGRIDASEERLKQHVSAECEKVETKLLTEFHKWGRTADMRTRQTMEANSFMNDRLLNAEDRITTLERNRLPPPATEAA